MQAHPVLGGSNQPVRSLSLPWWHSTVLGWSEDWQRITQRFMSRIIGDFNSRSGYYDPLTGLLNRTALEAKISALLASGSIPFAVLVLDIEGFSRINNGVGRVVGDLLLQRVSAQLQQLLQQRQIRSETARLEGDEFALLIYNSDLTLTQLIEDILGRISTPLYIDNQVFCLTARLGIAEWKLPGKTGADYIKHAEVALQVAKQSGQRQYVYSTIAMSSALTERLQIEAELRDALIANQLVIYYQPIVDGETLKVSGFEALIRWQHPQRGLISPTEFIPIAEQSGLILEIGWWAMTQACAQMVAWQRQFPACQDFKISVNVSNQQFLHPDCSQRIDEILQRTQLPPQNLTLEITESAFIEHNDATQATLDWIATQQIGLSIDDFGTGYSSLSYLYRFPVSTVKIDRSFIQASALARNSGMIVEAIIALGHKLGLDVVAEGVETAAAVDWLQQHRCNQLQGFLFSRPVTAAAATGLLTDDRFSFDPA